jgi:hypothetical protein
LVQFFRRSEECNPFLTPSLLLSSSHVYRKHNSEADALFKAFIMRWEGEQYWNQRMVWSQSFPFQYWSDLLAGSVLFLLECSVAAAITRDFKDHSFSLHDMLVDVAKCWNCSRRLLFSILGQIFYPILLM